MTDFFSSLNKCHIAPFDEYLFKRLNSQLPTLIELLSEIIKNANRPTEMKETLQTMLLEYPNLSSENQRNALAMFAILINEKRPNIQINTFERALHDSLMNPPQKKTHAFR
ncbi:MAG: hypothetical protein V4496_07600 [Pseudomonadota bacterium]